MNKTTQTLKTREQVLAEFKNAGITVAGWARANGFHRMTAVEVLRGTRLGLRGEAHRCALALGLKNGVMVDVANFKPAPARRDKSATPQARAAA